MRLTGAFVVAIVVVCGLVAARGQQSASTSPTFRLNVDLIQCDVVVLDKRRQPVRGLTAADFTILENGKPQTIAAFAAVDVPRPDEAAAPWTREVGADVTSNDFRARRLVLIVLDDGHTGPVKVSAVRTTANRIIDELGPNDLGAVVFTYLGRMQTFTADKGLLRAAVDSFLPQSFSTGPPLGCTLRVGGCAVNAVTRIAEALRSAPPGRKILFALPTPVPFDPRLIDRPDFTSGEPGVQDMYALLQRAQVSVYPIGPPDREGLARSTGGRNISATNTPWEDVPQVFQENSASYLLGYQSTNSTPDGQYRKITVTVNRPDVEVVTRDGYYASTKASLKKDAKPGGSALDEAIARGMPAGDLPLRVSTAAFAVPGRRQATLAVVVGVRDLVEEMARRTESAATPQVARVNLITTAFDTGWASKGVFRETVSLTLDPSAKGEVNYELLSQLPLSPGRYQIRVAAESGGRTGSAFVDVDVPDFQKDPLSVSGLLLERVPGWPVAPRDGLASVAPVVPTTARDFAHGDRVTAFLRVYESSSAAAPAEITTTIVDASGVENFRQTASLPATRFGPTHVADYRLDIPIAGLTSGPHLLTVDVTSGSHRVQRNLRFTVQ